MEVNIPQSAARLSKANSDPEGYDTTTITQRKLFFQSQEVEGLPCGAPTRAEIADMRKTADRMGNMKRIRVKSVPIEIQENLYLSSAIGASFKENLQNLGITDILCIMEKVNMPYPEEFTYKALLLKDEDTEKITQYFYEVVEYIHHVLITPGKKLLVHCLAGQSRSVTFIIAYLMNHRKMSRDEALAFMRTKSPEVCPNDGFMTQLLEYQKRLLNCDGAEYLVPSPSKLRKCVTLDVVPQTHQCYVTNVLLRPFPMNLPKRYLKAHIEHTSNLI